jgi:hypothetical protein
VALASHRGSYCRLDILGHVGVEDLRNSYYALMESITNLGLDCQACFQGALLRLGHLRKLLKLIVVCQELFALLGRDIALLGSAENFQQLIVHEHVQVLLEEVEAEVAEVHYLCLAGTCLGDLQYVRRYLNAAPILPLAIRHFDSPNWRPLWGGWGLYQKVIVEGFSRTSVHLALILKDPG